MNPMTHFRLESDQCPGLQFRCQFRPLGQIWQNLTPLCVSRTVECRKLRGKLHVDSPRIDGRIGILEPRSGPPSNTCVERAFPAMISRRSRIAGGSRDESCCLKILRRLIDVKSKPGAGADELSLLRSSNSLDWLANL
jgi:hypothetical protein